MITKLKEHNDDNREFEGNRRNISASNIFRTKHFRTCRLHRTFLFVPRLPGWRFVVMETPAKLLLLANTREQKSGDFTNQIIESRVLLIGFWLNLRKTYLKSTWEDSTGSRGAKFDLHAFDIRSVVFESVFRPTGTPSVIGAFRWVTADCWLWAPQDRYAVRRETREETDLSLIFDPRLLAFDSIKSSDFRHVVLYGQSLDSFWTISMKRSIKHSFRWSLFMAFKVDFRRMWTATYWWRKYVIRVVCAWPEAFGMSLFIWTCAIGSVFSAKTCHLSRNIFDQCHSVIVFVCLVNYCD